MDTLRAPNATHREKGMDVTALMDGKLTFHMLRSKAHKVRLAKELQALEARATHWG
jgi:hypothetical protein